jgi:hypothetical protein
MSKRITVHAPNINDLNKFNELTSELFIKYNIHIKDITYTKQSNIFNGIDWDGMPEFKFNDDIFESPSMIISYPKNNLQFVNELSKIINQCVTLSSTYIWYPKRLDTLNTAHLKYLTTNVHVPKYPIYIISKGRWESRLTSKFLERCNINYKIVIEPQEFENYNKYINASKILILPNEYLNKNQGSIPARNFVLKHSRDNNDKRHWILDDNISDYKRVNNNSKILIESGAIFTVIENYVDRFKNVILAGHNYDMFIIPLLTRLKPITKNTRIYSSILLDNSTPYEWRGKYNEDTDLSLRLLKAGYPTILFNNIVCKKETTLTMSGGNADIYKGDGVKLKAESLLEHHSDCVKIVTKFNRIHHQVDYSIFNNKLVYIDNYVKPTYINDMVLQEKEINQNIEIGDYVNCSICSKSVKASYLSRHKSRNHN